MSTFVPKTIDEAKETFRQYLKQSDEYERGNVITDNDSFTSYFCTNKESGETFQYVQMKNGANTHDVALKKFLTLCQAASSCNP